MPLFVLPFANIGQGIGCLYHYARSEQPPQGGHYNGKSMTMVYPCKHYLNYIVGRGEDVTTTATAMKVTVGELSVPYIGYQLCPW